MRNPFLIARTVFFCILVYLNILALGFAAWNLSAMKAAHLPILGAPIFVIFNVCVLFFFQLLAIAELASPSARTAQVGFECGWTAVMAILQLAAAIDMTLNGPPAYCYQAAKGSWALCSSASVLVAVAWASSSIMLLYFLTLFIISASHYSTYRGVWWTTVYNMPWFGTSSDAPSTARKITFPEPDIPRPMAPQSPYENPCFRDCTEDLPLTPPVAPWVSATYADLESQRASSDPRTSGASDGSRRPVWAKTVNTRRGVDPAFSPTPNPAKRISNALKSYWPRAAAGSTSAAGAPPPTPPPKLDVPPPHTLHGHTLHGSFVDCHRSSYGHFPNDVQDVDLPIARTHMRDWITAERAVLAH
ncbi:hypothetical protein BC629DRAFT_1436876 [Irpex lacteus]|nr:hypothetical protein BC629DRAFT_1436876 [Irpex lacteus]